jgi:hypothetical protein
MSLVVGMEPSGALVPTVEDFPEDLPFGCSAVPPPGRPARRRSLSDGPLIVAVVVGQEHGRWRSDFNAQHPLARGALELLDCATASGAPATPTGDGPLHADETSRLLGFVLLRSWHFVRDAPMSQQSDAMAKLLAHRHSSCSVIGYIEHAVVSAARLANPLSMPHHWERFSPAHVALQCVALASSARSCITAPVAPFNGATTVETNSNGMEDLLAHWRRLLPKKHRTCLWPLWFPLADAFVQGRWAVDVSVVLGKNKCGSWCPEVFPSRRQLQMFRANPPLSLKRPLERSTHSTRKKRSTDGGFIRAYDPLHLAAAVSVAENLSSDAKLVNVSNRVMQYLFPTGSDTLQRELLHTGFEHPSRPTLSRAKVRIDCACMLLRRELAAHGGAHFRYLGSDASPPSCGLELLVTVERTVSVRVLERAVSFSDVDAACVRSRHLPLATLGQGKAGVIDKAATITHQTWLEYGPSVASVVASNRLVRQFFSDMGTEFHISDHVDIVSGVLTGTPVGRQPAYLFPFAIGVPGPQHILDLVIRLTCQSFPWWASWEKRVKTITQYLHSIRHRDLLRQLVIEMVGDSAERVSMFEALRKPIDKWANWRWKTLHKAISGLLRVRSVLRLVFARTDVLDRMAARDSSEASALVSAVLDASTWDCAQALHHLFEDVWEFSGWLRGCECHDAELRAGKVVKCGMKGHRAPYLRKRVSGLCSILQQKRDLLYPFQFGSVDIIEIGNGFNRLSAMLRTKFHWLDELPFSVWEVAPRPNNVIASTDVYFNRRVQ